MDFVKSNWFPSQRRAKVCVVRVYQGLKTAEQTASRYEVWLNLGRKVGIQPNVEEWRCPVIRQLRRFIWSDKLIICVQCSPAHLEKTHSSL